MRGGWRLVDWTPAGLVIVVLAPSLGVVGEIATIDFATTDVLDHASYFTTFDIRDRTKSDASKSAYAAWWIPPTPL